LNRLPLKDGRRWAVFPLRLERGGLRLRGSLRILLKGEGPPLEAERFAADLEASGPEGPGRRWLFTLEACPRRGELRLSPPPSPEEAEALERELGEGIRVRLEEAPPFADSRNDALLELNREV
jgi:hypothetical protein